MDEQFDDIEKTLWEQMGKLPVPEPSKDVKIRFHAMLDTFKAEEEAKKKVFFKSYLNVSKRYLHTNLPIIGPMP